MIKYIVLSTDERKTKAQFFRFEAREKRPIYGKTKREQIRIKEKSKYHLSESSSDKEKTGRKQNRKWKGERTNSSFQNIQKL